MMAALVGVLLSWNWRWLTSHSIPLFALLLLVDPVWGAWWHWASAPRSPKEALSDVKLPYEQSTSPHRYLNTLWSRGFWSGMLLTLGIGFGLATLIGEYAFWLNGIALALAGFAWWLSHVYPHGLPWLRAVYGVGLPLWAGGYAFGVQSSLLLWIALGGTSLLWLKLLVQQRHMWH